RFGTVYVPHGVVMRDWLPRPGAHWSAAPTLRPLAGLRKHVTLVSGLSLPASTSHSHAQTRFCSAAQPAASGPVRLGVSIDQAIATRLEPGSRLRSLALRAPDKPELHEHDAPSECVCTYL